MNALIGTEGMDLSFYEFQGVLHVWMLFGLPESRKAIEQVVSAIDVISTKGTFGSRGVLLPQNRQYID